MLFVKGDFSGAFFQAGVAELSMACICIGMSLHGGVIAACGTFFVFSDYMKPALRMAALMEQPVKFIWTHDAFRVGEDGPTHDAGRARSSSRLLEKLKNHKGHNSMLVTSSGRRCGDNSRMETSDGERLHSYRIDSFSSEYHRSSR